jgi:hypothetical protein
MPLFSIRYEEAAPRLAPGDVIAFSGKARHSRVIKWATRSPVSHVGIIFRTGVRETDERPGELIVESADLNGFFGVNVSRFDRRMTEYDGHLWWLPLRRAIRETAFRLEAFYDFLQRQAKSRRPYDIPQALKAGIDLFDKLPGGRKGPTYNREDFSSFFCAELVAAGLEAAGAVPRINCSEVTPADLCTWSIFEDDYFLLKGAEGLEIAGYNSRDPAAWNV